MDMRKAAAAGLALEILIPYALGAQPTPPVRASTEELVYARAADGVVNGGAFFAPAAGADKRIAVIWIHGTGINFYYPSYVNVARELAQRNLATIVGNTRMHDLGNTAAFRETANLRGGSYWGITTEQVRDLAAWVQFAKDRGFRARGARWTQRRRHRGADIHVEDGRSPRGRSGACLGTFSTGVRPAGGFRATRAREGSRRARARHRPSAAYGPCG
jgi:hypothetical protein